MRCPFCQSPVEAGAAECGACRLTFPRTAALAGAPPRLSQPVADTNGLLAGDDRARLRKRIDRIRRHFPELVLQVAVHAFPAEHPFSMHAFWLFNAGNFAGDSRRGNANHALLLALDPGRGEAAIVPGYGLEPFLEPESLDRLLKAASPAWQAGRWADGILTVLDELEPLLEAAAIPEDASPRAETAF
jgi:uncharacterized membrane protein YgcG